MHDSYSIEAGFYIILKCFILFLIILVSESQLACIFKWKLVSCHKHMIFNFEKVSMGMYHFKVFFPQKDCFVRTLWKQVLFLWKIFISPNWPLSGKKNSNIQLSPSHSWHGPLPCLLVSTIVCFVVFSSLRCILSVDFKGVADSTILNRYKASALPFSSLNPSIPNASSNLPLPLFSTLQPILGITALIVKLHYFFFLSSCASGVEITKEKKKKEKVFSLSNPASYFLIASSNMEVQFQGKCCSPLKEAQLLWRSALLPAVLSDTGDIGTDRACSLCMKTSEILPPNS